MIGYSAIIQTIIAFLAFVISLFEVYNYAKEKKSVKEKENVEKKLVTVVSGISLEEEINTVKTSETNITVKSEENIEKFIKAVEKTIKIITPLYKQLLQDESCFSLSYGFDRYISSFRKIYFEGNEVLEELKGLIYTFSKANEKVNMFSETENNEIFIQNINEMLNASKQGMSDEEIDELTYTAQKDNNAYKSTMSYYYHYKGIFKCINRIKEIYEGIDPLLKELQLKYKNN